MVFGAVRRDKEQRIFADPARVHKVEHQGTYYQVNSYHLCEPSPQRTPVLFQAGTSDRGQLFAARHAEAVFIFGNQKETVRKSVQSLRAAAVEAGRAPDDIKIVLGISAVSGATQQAAQEKYEEYLALCQPRSRSSPFCCQHWLLIFLSTI